jgi:Cation transport ATPase
MQIFEQTLFELKDNLYQVLIKAKMSTNKELSRKRANLKRQSSITQKISNEHLLKLEELCSQLNTSYSQGLSTKIAKKTLKTYGYNEYSKPKVSSNGALTRLFHKQPGEERNMIDTSWTKRDWNRVFNSRSYEQYIVVRNGARALVRRRDIVPGDLVILQTKQTVPADMRVINYDGELVVDNRIITGNTAELKSISSTSNDFLLSQNMIFACTDVLSGSCEAIVIKTGDDTVFAELTQFAQKVRLAKRHDSVSLSSSSSGSSNSIGPSSTRDIDDSRNPNNPPSPVFS